MSVVPYDEDFDAKVTAGAEALLKQRNIVQANTSPEYWQNAFNIATSEARIVLLAAMAVVANKKKD